MSKNNPLDRINKILANTFNGLGGPNYDLDNPYFKDLHHFDMDGDNALSYALSNNKYDNINLTRNELKYLLENSILDVRLYHKHRTHSPLQIAIYNYTDSELPMDRELFHYLIAKSDINYEFPDPEQGLENYTIEDNALIAILAATDKFPINSDDMMYIAKNVNANTQDLDGCNALYYDVKNNCRYGRELTKYLIANTNEEIINIMFDGGKYESVYLSVKEEMLLNNDYKNYIQNNQKSSGKLKL